MQKKLMKEKMSIFAILVIAMLLGLTGCSTAENSEKVSGENTLKVETEYTYNETDNTVIGKIISNNKLKDTKPTWKLDENKCIYTKKFKKNEEYKTKVEDIYGNKIDVNINVDKIDENGPIVKVEYNYNENENTVTAVIKSNEEMAETKPTWKISEDKTEYKKEFNKNQQYKTKVADKWLNQTEVEICIEKIDDKRARNKNGISI